MAKSAKDLIGEIDARVRKNRAIPRSGPEQLPLWRDHLRGLPNAMARSALFTVGNHRAPREEFKREKIAAVAGYEIFYTGTELRQDDEDVFLQVVHFARMHPLGEVVEISGNALLRALGWNSSSKSYTRLRDIIERLKEGTIKISHENGRRGYAGSMIRKFAWQDESDSAARTKWKIYLEKEIVELFADDEYTALDWADRSKLGYLAKWLHSFYYTHREPLPYKVTTLYTLCASKAADLREFRRMLKNALDELVDIGFLLKWRHVPEVDTIMVHRNLGKLENRG
jgi:hypothetical protein